MVEMEKKEIIKSRCGIDCNECSFKKEEKCKGCVNIDKPFWGNSCQIKTCCENKKIKCCGECEKFPCKLLISFAYDKNQGDNGLRIENCKKWCNKK